MSVSVYSRYHGCAMVKSPGPDGQKKVTSSALRLPEKTEEFPDSIIHTVVGQERLDQLSYKYYGREDLWWRILDANDLQLSEEPFNSDPRLFKLQSGDQLIIPPIRTVTRFPRK